MDEELDGSEGAYRPPTDIVSYRGGQVPDTACAAGLGVDFWSENAAYCPADQAIYYDEAWLRDYQFSGGNIAPATILAHEWGHRVQDLVGIEVTQETRYQELQADCLAGIFLGQREMIVDAEYVLLEDDLATALETVFELGDEEYDKSRWLDPQYHGSNLQRLMAFATGYLGSVGEGAPFGRVSNYFPWCYGYRDFEAEEFAEIGPYRLIEPPGRTAESNGNTYSIAPLEASGTTSSSIVLAWLDGATSPDAILKAGKAQFPGMQQLEADVSMPTSVGELVFFYFEQAVAGDVRSGFYGVFPATSEGALAMMVYRNEAAIREMSDPRLSVLTEEIAAFGQIAGRLCAPGQSETPGDPGFSVACAQAQ